ncbi:MFS transporter [Natronospira bacteriovora]|uniref:MFS transporter n=1 Tax=Natronospira bacteriovora TaxID=3069753 RepID=A0ABU0W6Q8_9GAMM|nr:MFS transporter [Natronospira sp. AB-CW4]MDQ2069691.1 MFS transporter [Natronospira sp. AB-CW4]
MSERSEIKVRDPEQLSNRAYAVLSGDDQTDRLCEAIPESACSNLPRNYLLNVGNGASSKLAEQVAGPNVVLPWLLGAIGAPAALIGLLMPIKQAGSLLPQLAIAGWIRSAARRKFFWVLAGVVQALCLLLMIPAAEFLPAATAGWVIIALLAVFAIASGTASVAFQDVVGKTIPKGRRGRLLANRAAIGGALTIVAGLLINQYIGHGQDMLIYLGLVFFGAMLWFLAAGLFLMIKETPGATEGGRNAIQEAGNGIRLVKRLSAYRRYLLARALLLTVEVATPLFVLFGQGVVVGSAVGLGMFVIAVGVAQVIGSPFWGYFADASARRVLYWSALIAAAAGMVAIAIGLLPEGWRVAPLYAVVFVLIGLAEAGVRLGRKTWLVDAAPAADRPTWVAFSNTSIGLLTLAAGGLGLIAQFAGLEAMMLTIVALCLAGAAAAWFMPEASDAEREALND